MANGAGAGFGPQHSQSPENWFLNIPGLKIVVPGTVENIYALLRSAVRDEDPVLVFEHEHLFAIKGRVPAEPDDTFLVPIGVADIARTGADVKIVATQQMRHRALEAADHLAPPGDHGRGDRPANTRPVRLRHCRGVAAQDLAAGRRPGRPAGRWVGATLMATTGSRYFEHLDAPKAWPDRVVSG